MTSQTPARPVGADRAIGLGLVLGAGIAFAFALVISLFPAWVFTDVGPRVVLYLLVALSSPLLVLPLWSVGPRLGLDARTLAWATLGGAMLFDGTALAFVPGLYGQTGDAWAYTGAMLLWAFGWLVVTELIVERRRR
jgi:hypothetical protein